MSNTPEHTVQILNSSGSPGKWDPVVGRVTASLRDYFVTSKTVSTPRGASRVIEEARSILSRCAAPYQGKPPKTGLVCGYVQSGKTASMTAVSALAKDNRYRIIIMMGGVTTNLLDQTNERLQTHLRDASGEWTWLMLTNPTLKGDRVEIASLTQEWRSHQYEEEDRRTLFIAVMKNHARIRQLAELLSSIDLSDIPAIIFDDEADQASLNTRPDRPRGQHDVRNHR